MCRGMVDGDGWRRRHGGLAVAVDRVAENVADVGELALNVVARLRMINTYRDCDMYRIAVGNDGGVVVVEVNRGRRFARPHRQTRAVVANLVANGSSTYLVAVGLFTHLVFLVVFHKREA